MSSWLLFSILAPLFWGLSNPLDSALRRHFIKNDFVLTWLLLLGRLLLAGLLVLLWDVDLVWNMKALALMLAGFLLTIPFILYFRALEFEETSRVIIFTQMGPIAVFLLAYIFLGETLTFLQLMAFFSILVGGTLAAFKKSEQKWHFSKAFGLIAVASLMWSTSDVAFKYLEPFFADFKSAFVVYFFGGGLPALFVFLMPKKLQLIKHHLSGLAFRAWSILVVTFTSGLLGSIFVAYALTMGKASLTVVFAGMQPLFAFLFGLLFVTFIKEVPKESVTKMDVLLKSSALVLIFVGLVYLNYPLN